MAKWVDIKILREHLDFHDVLAHYGIGEKGKGEQFKIVCPFHNDHKPSCGINMTKQVYNCFACDAGGNARDFVAQMEGHDPDVPKELRKAAMTAAEIFGIEEAWERPAKRASKAKPESKAAKAKPKKVSPKQSPKVANDNAVLADTEVEEGREEGNKPLTFTLDLNPWHDFIEERGFGPKLVQSFGIGFQDKGMMAGRICFPIHNADRELVAYSGRWASGDLPEDVPRYLLPPKFKKNLELFNLHRVIAEREEQAEVDTVMIVEGFWSVLRLHEAGVPCVSTFGDSVSEAQVDLLVQHGL